MAQTGYLLPNANIEWQGETPVSTDFNDLYWSRDAGIAEKTHVFLRGTALHQRWQQLTPSSHFTVGEIGFGFGLNFLLTAAAWRKGRIPGILHYISIENQPIRLDDLAQLATVLPHALVNELLTSYPLPTRGRHLIWFGENIRLTLIFDDARTALKHLSAHVDAWFLDGFSPNKNATAWQKREFAQMYSMARPGALLATYSAAGGVRRQLKLAGFNVNRKPGFGAKREMLSAAKPGAWIPMPPQPRRVAVIGAGIAGTYLHEALQRRDLSVTVFDDDDATSTKIRQLAVYPTLASRTEQRYRFALTAFEYATRDNPFFHPCGLVIQPKNDHEHGRWQKICALFPDEFLCQTKRGAFFPAAGWIDSRGLSNQIRSTKATIAAVNREHDQWYLSDESGQVCAKADVVIFATGAKAPPFTTPWEMDVIPGLALTIRAKTTVSEVRSSDVTVFPNDSDGVQTVSGIYDRSMAEPSSSHIGALLTRAGNDDYTAAKIGLRATTRDRLPVCGAVPVFKQLIRHDPAKPFADYHPGLYILGGLGSHGATTSRLCAEHIANLITGEPAALDKPTQRMLSAERFHLRSKRKFATN